MQGDLKIGFEFHRSLLLSDIGVEWLRVGFNNTFFVSFCNVNKKDPIV